MSLTTTAVEKKTVTYFAAFLIFTAGIAAFFSLGQLEDPDFTVKTATISTTYLGASPEEVELEVTDRIELALQEMKQIWYIKSKSGATTTAPRSVEAKTSIQSLIESLPLMCLPKRGHKSRAKRAGTPEPYR